MTTRRVARDERGFTLVEVVMAVVLSSIIFAAISQTVFQGLKTIDATNDKLAGSNDTQLLAHYFTGDVDSADTVSTTGATRHAAPSVSVGSANSVLAAFWTLRSETTLTPPTGATEAWDLASTGVTAGRIAVAMADETVQETGASGNRIATSALGTSSIGHSVLLTRAPLTTVTRRGVATASTSGAPSLTVARPAETNNGDVLLAQIAVADGTTSITAPSGWTPVNARSAPTTQSRLYRHTAASGDPTSWSWTFGGGSVQAAGGLAAYGNVLAVAAQATEVSPCGGDKPALLLGWTDFSDSTLHEVTYNVVTDGNETHLVRRECTGPTGTTGRSQVLARRLNSSQPTDVFAECQPVACGPLATGVSVTLTVTEKPAKSSTTPRVYQLRGTTRTNR